MHTRYVMFLPQIFRAWIYTLIYFYDPYFYSASAYITSYHSFRDVLDRSVEITRSRCTFEDETDDRPWGSISDKSGNYRTRGVSHATRPADFESTNASINLVAFQGIHSANWHMLHGFDATCMCPLRVYSHTHVSRFLHISRWRLTFFVST